MSLRDKLVRPALLALAVVAIASLAACSFTPLYGESGVTRLDLAYPEPDSRLEQIIYQDLALRLGRSQAVDAPLVDIALAVSSRRIGRTSAGSPQTTSEAILTATIKVVRPGLTEDDPTEVVYSTTRKASASYTTNGQRLADQQAVDDAQERAALSLAQTIRLLLAAELPGRLSGNSQ